MELFAISIILFLIIISVFLYTCTFMYVCMYVCTYVCTHLCMYVHMYACKYACMYVYMYACKYVYMYVCMYACMYTCIYVRVHLSTYVSKYSMIVNMYTSRLCLHTRAHVLYSCVLLKQLAKTHMLQCKWYSRITSVGFEHVNLTYSWTYISLFHGTRYLCWPGK